MSKRGREGFSADEVAKMAKMFKGKTFEVGELVTVCRVGYPDKKPFAMLKVERVNVLPLSDEAAGAVIDALRPRNRAERRDGVVLFAAARLALTCAGAPRLPEGPLVVAWPEGEEGRALAEAVAEGRVSARGAVAVLRAMAAGAR